MIQKIAQLKIESKQMLWRLLGPSLYDSRPLFPITIRELLQNSADAQRTNAVSAPVEFWVEVASDGSWILSCQDRGIGMTEDVLLDKFLALGGSDKQSSDNAGGFGVAKASIIGACSSWQVETLDNYLDSDMIDRDPIRKVSHKSGCKILLKFDPKRFDPKERCALYPHETALAKAIALLGTSRVANIIMTKCGTEELRLTLPGFVPGMKSLIQEIVDATTTIRVYQVPSFTFGPFLNLGTSSYSNKPTTKKISSKIIVRLNGLTQYIGYAPNEKADFNVMIDVETKARPGDAQYPFVVSRESLTWEYEGKMEPIIKNLFINHVTSKINMLEKNSKKKTKTKFYDGSLRAPESQISRKDIAEAKLQQTQELLGAQLKAAIDELAALAATGKPGQLPRDAMQEVAPMQHLTMSATGIKTCIKYRNKRLGKVDSSRNVKVLMVWAQLVEKLMQVDSDYAHPFGIGLLFDEHRRAMRFTSEEQQAIYYLVNCTEMKISKPLDTVLDMFHLATHEVTHALYADHDESFTCAYDRLYRGFITKFGMRDIYALARQLRGGRTKPDPSAE